MTVGPVIGHNQHRDPYLVIHNSFALMRYECGIPSGEALPEDMDTLVTSQNSHNDISSFDTKTLEEIVYLESGSEQEAPNTLLPCDMPQPITTYHTSLSTDKLSVLESVNAPMHTAFFCSFEAQRRVDVLQKFWGDYTNEEHGFCLVFPSTARNKKQKKQTNRQASPKNKSSEHIQTRSKQGVVKSNLKYL